MTIKKFEDSFQVSVTGEVTGEAFKGVFKVRTRLSFKDALARDSVRRNLLGSVPEAASERANSIADVFSELAVRITDAPSWWTNSDGGLELADDNIVAAVYKATMNAGKSAAKEEADKAAANLKELDLAKEE